MRRYVLFCALIVVFNSNAQFTPGNIVVSRIGDGVTPLSSSIRVELVEYTTAGIPTGVVATLPFVSSGPGNRACTNNATSTTEGIVTMSYDGRYLVHVGYDAPEGIASVPNSTSDYNRTIARIDASGTVNTSTSFSSNPTDGIAYGRSNIRAAYSLDGTQFWASGVSGGVLPYTNTGGVRYIGFGNDNIPGTQISTTVTNTRSISVFNDQLYISSAAFPYRIATVGTGTPTTSGQTITNLPANIPTLTTLPNAFIFFDRDPTISGVDLLYYASQSAVSNEYGLLKFSFDGTTWTARGKLADATVADSQVSGLTGYLDCSGNVVLYLTRASSSTGVPFEIRTFTDNAAYNANITSNGTSIFAATTLLVTAGTNYAFRGLAMAPAQGYTVTGTQSIAAGSYNVITVKSGGVATLTGNITVYDRIVVESGGVLEMGSFTISSPAGIGSRFEVKSGGTIKIGSADGITASAALGNVQTCFRKFDAGANYEYYANAVQVTGDGLPSSLTGTLKINNSAGLPTTGVTLSQSTTVAGTLDLTLGKLTTSAGQLVTINNGASIINAGANSFINGPAKKVGDDASFTFPVGKGSIYAPIGISGGTGANASDEFTAEYVRGNPQSSTGACPIYCQPGMDHVSYVEYWTLDRNVASTATKQITLDVHATSFCAEIENTYVSQWDPSAPDKWSKEPSSFVQTGSIGVLDLGNITTVSPISNFAINRYLTLGTDRPFLNNPLPVTLVDFKVKKYSEQAAIAEWELTDYCFTATQFELEHSTDKTSFAVIAVQPGKENSRFYFHNDTRIAKGTNWYRLKITEVDGKITYSKIIAVINDTKGLLITSVFPNPVSNTATITLSAARSGMADVQLYDISGTVVYRRRSAIAEGTNNLPIEMGKLSTGVYHLAVQSADCKAVYRLVKQ